MTTAIEISELGMINDLRLLNMISNNIANVNTMGFKRDMPISEPFAAQLQDSLASLQLGRQVDLVPELKPLVDFSAGALRQTSNPLDLAIEGDAYFELSGQSGLRYSRQGSFSLDATGRLVNGSGYALMGEDGEILLQGGRVSIDREGNVLEEGKVAGRIKLAHFADTSTLQKAEDGVFMASSSPQVVADSSASVRQGYLESANVDVMKEMVKMIMTARHFETTQRVMRGYDDMINSAIDTIAEF